MAGGENWQGEGSMAVCQQGLRLISPFFQLLPPISIFPVLFYQLV